MPSPAFPRTPKVLATIIAIGSFTTLAVAGVTVCIVTVGNKPCCSIAGVQLWAACNPSCPFTNVVNPSVPHTNAAGSGKKGLDDYIFYGVQDCKYTPSTCGVDGTTCSPGTVQQTTVCYPTGAKGNVCTGV